MTAALALTAAQQLADSWRIGVCSLPDDRVPCQGLFSSEWPGVRRAMMRFIDEWGADAARLGWSTEALFGVHRLAGTYRVDSTGALIMLRPYRCIGLCERELHLERRGSVLVARGLTNPAESVAIWDFRRG